LNCRIVDCNATRNNSNNPHFPCTLSRIQDIRTANPVIGIYASIIEYACFFGSRNINTNASAWRNIKRSVFPRQATLICRTQRREPGRIREKRRIIKEFTLRVFVSLMLHEEGPQLILLHLRPDRQRNFLVTRFRAITIHDFCRVTGGLPKEQLHVRLPVLLGDFDETADYEDRELLELLKQESIFPRSTSTLPWGH